MTARPILTSVDDERLVKSIQTAGFLPVPVGENWLDEFDREDRTLALVDDSCDPEVRAHLRGAGGARRRDLFVVAMSESVVTGDMMEAWRRSVDLVLNPADLPRLVELIDAGIAAKAAFYVRFRELARAQGEA